MSALSTTRSAEGVLTVRIDLPGEKVNVLSSRLLGEIEALLDEVERDDAVVAVVLASGKPDSFIAGADLDEIATMTTAETASSLVRDGHRLLDRVASSRKPYVAAIHGAALGGGLEVALACHARIASNHPKTVLGLPEVTLGVLPAAGGTQRLPRLIGLRRALPMLLTGKRVRSRKALDWGLVDEVAEADDLVGSAERLALRLSRGKASRAVGPSSIVDRLMLAAPARGFVLRAARKSARRATRGLYPAPSLILDCVERGLRDGFDAGRKKEIEAFGSLVVSPVATNLLWLFRAMTDLKKPPVEADRRRIREVAVLGAGLMGEGIASVSLPLAGVVVRDISDAALQKTTRHIASSLAKREASGAIAFEDAQRQREHLRVTREIAHVAGADLVIEAVFEDIDVKRQVLAETEAVVSDDAIVASNTSALPIREIARDAKHPERILGMHYFSPVPKMPLLEIVEAERTSREAIATAHAFGTAQGKTVIVVGDGPGFYTTRILGPYMNEAILLLEEGVAIPALDSALRDFGFPVGPVTLLDEVGLDVAAHVAHDLGHAFADRGLEPSQALSDIVHAGYLGRKSGAGFFVYAPRRKKKINEAIYSFFGVSARQSHSKTDIIDRLSLMMVGEAVRCLEESVIRSPRDGDVGAILGLGFPPFRGGPFHYVDAIGAGTIVPRMEELASRLGKRFQPPRRLIEMAEKGAKFY